MFSTKIKPITLSFLIGTLLSFGAQAYKSDGPEMDSDMGYNEPYGVEDLSKYPVDGESSMRYSMSGEHDVIEPNGTGNDMGYGDQPEGDMSETPYYTANMGGMENHMGDTTTETHHRDDIDGSQNMEYDRNGDMSSTPPHKPINMNHSQSNHHHVTEQSHGSGNGDITYIG